MAGGSQKGQGLSMGASNQTSTSSFPPGYLGNRFVAPYLHGENFAGSTKPDTDETDRESMRLTRLTVEADQRP